MVEIGGARRSARKPKYNKLPMCALRRLALRFELGEQYDQPDQTALLNGKMNWQDGDETFWTDAYNHALEHLMLSRFDTSEDHLAAVGWYVAARMYAEETGPKEQATPDPKPPA